MKWFRNFIDQMKPLVWKVVNLSPYHALGQLRFIAGNCVDWFRRVDRGPLVSIVVPLYNTERYVAETLASVRKQSYTNWECIVVDDASPDRAVDVVQRFIARDSRFRLVHHESNRGLAASRNTGLREARGELITFLDSDDTLLGHSLAQRVRVIEERNAPDLAGAFCGVINTPEAGRRLLEVLSMILSAPKEDVDFLVSKGKCPFASHSPLLRAGLLRKLHGFDENLRTAEDFEMWQRIMRRGYYFAGSGRFGVTYRQRPGSMIHDEPLKHLRVALSLIERANQPVQNEDDDEDCPFFFSEPLGTYENQLFQMERTANFASMAYLGGAVEHAREMINTLPAGTGIWVTRHLDIGQIVSDAAKRLRLRLSEPPPETELQRRIGEVRELIMRRLNAPRAGDSRQSENKQLPGVAA